MPLRVQPFYVSRQPGRFGILCCLGQRRDGGRAQTRNSVTAPSLNIYLKQQLTSFPPSAERCGPALRRGWALSRVRSRPCRSSRSRRPRCIGCYLRQQPGIAKLASGSFSVLLQIWRRVIYLCSRPSLGEARRRACAGDSGAALPCAGQCVRQPGTSPGAGSGGCWRQQHPPVVAHLQITPLFRGAFLATRRGTPAYPVCCA